MVKSNATLCKALCVLIAAGNLFAMALVIRRIVESIDEDPLLLKFISPCLANMVLAVLLIIGIATEEISFVRLFKMFFYGQLVFALMMVLFGYRLADLVKWPLVEKGYFIAMFAVCGIELIIVSSTMDSMRKPVNVPPGVVAYVPTTRTV